MLNHLVEKAYADSFTRIAKPLFSTTPEGKRILTLEDGTIINMTDVAITDIMKLINDLIIPIALDVAIIVGVIMIFYSAFLYVSSFGEEAKAETAKKTLLWSIIGTVVVFLAKTIVDAVDKYLG